MHCVKAEDGLAVEVIMSSITLSAPKALSPTVSTPRKGFFARLFDAIVAAQTAKAERELAFYIRRTGRDLNV